MLSRLSLTAALLLSAGVATAQTSITIGMQLEPPNLDPTGGAILLAFAAAFAL